MSTVTATEVFAQGQAAAADWLSDNHKREKQISLAKCRAIRLADMVLQYEAAPHFDELLAAWEQGFDSALRAAAPASTRPDDMAAPTASVFEDRFEQFTDQLIAAHPGAAPLMRDLNKMATICAGLGTVLRIVAGNVVVQDNFNPDDPTSVQPLSQGAVCNLVAMAAAVCEGMNDSVGERADSYKSRVPA